MKLNANTYIFGENVILVPYEKWHVPKYHAWMQRSDLREATASDLLSLDEEYEMQQKWREDEDKCTFIVLSHDTSTRNTLKILDNDQEEKLMIGDVNLYIREEDEKKIAEVGVMIAENQFRGRGLGFETIIAMMLYGVRYLNITIYEAKIGFDNSTSKKLFEKIGFKLINSSSVFEEETYQINISPTWLNEMSNWTSKIHFKEN